MKITTLLENTSVSPELTAEHGLSLFVETAQHRFLFDAGQSDAFAENAKKLGIDLRTAEFAVLSHGHYDHGGGMRRFLEVNRRAKLYVNSHAFGDHYNGTQKYIGLDRRLGESSRLVLTGDEFTIAPGLTLHSCNDRERSIPTDSFGLTERLGAFFLPDDFLHEHYLLMEEQGRRVLLSGCSHKGILNIVEWFKPDVLVGGFHFRQLAPDSAQLRAYGEALAKYDTVFYTGHCTGQAQFDVLKEILGDRLHAISTGAVIEL